MVIQNLNFFDKFGKNLNLDYNSETDLWTGKIFFEQISIALFDNENLFILEKAGSQYKFPTLSPNQSIKFLWESSKWSDQLFLYDVVKDLELNENFISKTDEYTVSYSDLNSSGLTTPLDFQFPLQVNIAFSPTDELAYIRDLNIYLVDTGVETKIATIQFYGEGENEESRFNTWLQNFGIKFLREDANILKDYDIKEALPDLEALNLARKELLVNREEIYPYIGTYKGLINFINILGYRDVLKVKEYWQNINTSSSYFDKLSLVNITDYLDDGKIDTLDLSDANSNLKSGRQFKKTEFLALTYEFTQESGRYDDDGIPIVVETTEFTVDEIFYKLNKLNKKLKNEFLPINVKIKDIIGEFIYFQKLTISYWTDSTLIFDYDLNDTANLSIYPDINTNLVLRTLDPLYKKLNLNGIAAGVVQFNDASVNPFSNSQRYQKADIPGIIGYIKDFYNQIRDQRFPDLNAKLSWEFGDDPEKVIGAPVVLSLDTNRFKVEDLKGVRLDELDAFGTQYWTLANIDYRNFYEVNWKITKSDSRPYSFKYRGKVADLYELPHFLPYTGQYRVTVELYDFYGNVSVYSKWLTVSDQMKPEIIGFTRLEDKFNYQISNLSNVRLQDFSSSPLYYPRVNVLNNEEIATTLNIYRNLTEWSSYFKNGYGTGQNLYFAEIYNTATDEYIPYLDSTQDHPKKSYWGIGQNDTPVKLKDFSDIQLGSLYWLRLANLVFTDDFNAGFYFTSPNSGEIIKISGFPDYIIPSFIDLFDLVSQLNSSNHPGIKLFNYEVINNSIHAQAEYLSKEMYHILYFSGENNSVVTQYEYITPGYIAAGYFEELSQQVGSPYTLPETSGANMTIGDNYTFFLPKKVYSSHLINQLKSISPVFDPDTLFLHAKTSDLLTGAVNDYNFWATNKYLKYENSQLSGFLPTVIDQNAFNLTDIKLFKDTFNTPENGILFFVINNLDGKSDFIWTLTDYNSGEEIIRVKSVPFFVWKFKDIGQYTLSVTVIDNRGTQYKNEVQNFIRVLAKDSYIRYVESTLNTRKAQLSKKGN
jgi:hypothetical protein